MNQNLEQFLKHDAVALLRKLDPNTPNVFGKMNVQQMLEHLAEWISISSGKIHFDLQTPQEHLPKWKAFILSDKEMRPNTPNSLMSDEPIPAKLTNTQEACDNIQYELEAYINRFRGKEIETETHPFFGPLTFDEWAVLHAKHIRHHLRQFGVEI